MTKLCLCPYCDSESFVGDVSVDRGNGDVSNQCNDCYGWSFHDEINNKQLELVDRGDPNSDIIEV
jgi:hypothetical protein